MPWAENGWWKGGRLIALVGASAFAVHLVGLGGLPLIDRDEPRFAEASREMLERGDFVVPWFNGEERFDKPPLIYWCQMAAYRVLGEGEFAARLPSAAAAALAAAAICGFGMRLGGRRVGLLGALFFTLCVQVVVHARASAADMAMVAAAAAGLWAGWETACRARPGGARFVRWWCVLTACIALGFLAKGPVAWVPLVPFALVAARRLGGGRAAGWAALAWVVSMLVVGIWGVPALAATGGEFFEVGIGKHVVRRSFSVMEGHGVRGAWGYLLTLPTYFVTIFISFFPWSIWLPWLVRRCRADRRVCRAATRRYLVVSVAVVFVVFTLVKTKLPHYILPSFPALALLLAREWVRAGRGMGIPLRVGLGTLALAWGVALGVAPLVRPLFTSCALFEAVGPRLRAETRVGAAGYAEPSLVWYFRGVVEGPIEFLREDEVDGFLDEDAESVLVVTAEHEARLWGGRPRPGLGRVEVRGVNFVRGLRPVRLVALWRE